MANLEFLLLTSEYIVKLPKVFMFLKKLFHHEWDRKSTRMNANVRLSERRHCCTKSENTYLHGSTGPVLNSGRILVQLVPQPPTALAVYVCTHTAQKPVAPPRLPLCLGRGSRGKVMAVLWLEVPALSRSYLRSSYTWGTRVVPFALMFHLYAWSSIVSLVLTLQLFLGY